MTQRNEILPTTGTIIRWDTFTKANSYSLSGSPTYPKWLDKLIGIEPKYYYVLGIVILSF